MSNSPSQCKIIRYTCPINLQTKYRYSFKFTLKGRQIRLRKQGFLTESEARESFEAAYWPIKLGYKDPPETGTRQTKAVITRPTFAEVLDIVRVKWLERVKESTVQTYMYKINRNILPYIKDKIFSKITDSDIKLLYEHLDNTSNNNITAPFQSLIRVAKELDIDIPTIKENTWKRTKVNNREEYLTAEEVHIFLDSAKPEFKHLFALMIYTGIRIGEARGLDWSDINLQNRTIKIERQLSTNTDKISTPKSGKTRVIPINDNLIKILKSFAQETGSDWIVKGRMFTMCYDVIARELIRCRSFVGKDIVIHSLRHTAASLMIQNNIPVEKIGKIMGQSTTAITEKYAHLSSDSLRSAIDVLPVISL